MDTKVWYQKQYPTVEEVLFVFNGRCPKCRGRADDVHELEPRSRGKSSMRMTNRTAICRRCHDEFHRLGASEENIKKWKVIIHDFLENIGSLGLYVDGSTDQ